MPALVSGGNCGTQLTGFPVINLKVKSRPRFGLSTRGSCDEDPSLVSTSIRYFETCGAQEVH